jgi:hypothetical protein
LDSSNIPSPFEKIFFLYSLSLRRDSFNVPSPLRGEGRVRVKHFLSLRITEGNVAISTGQLAKNNGEAD